MANDIVVLNLDGEVPLKLFAQALTEFSDLVQELNKEIADDANIRWVVSRLEVGSALTEARGYAKTEDKLPAIERVADAYLTVGKSLARGEPIPFGRRIRNKGTRLRDLLNGDIPAMRFENAEDDITIAKLSPGGRPQPLPVSVTYGAVEGRVQTLSNRGSLRFTVYDLTYDKAVSCYLAEGQEEMMRDMWGRIAIVDGLIKRDELTGRPLTVRQVRSVHSLAERPAGDYQTARGAVPRGDSLRSEEVIRQGRDAV